MGRLAAAPAEQPRAGPPALAPAIIELPSARRCPNKYPGTHGALASRNRGASPCRSAGAPSAVGWKLALWVLSRDEFADSVPTATPSAPPAFSAGALTAGVVFGNAIVANPCATCQRLSAFARLQPLFQALHFRRRRSSGSPCRVRLYDAEVSRRHAGGGFGREGASFLRPARRQGRGIHEVDFAALQARLAASWRR